MIRAFRDAAVGYAWAGWKVLPLRPEGKAPLGRLVPNGKDDATNDLATALRWWTNAPRANIGVYCRGSGLVALDVDPRNAGDDAFHDLEREHGELPTTVEAHSGGGGRHLIFQHPGGDLVGHAAPGVDVKDEGYVVAPPSIHPSGGRYVWSVDGHPQEVSPAILPDAWVRALRAPKPVRRNAREPVAEDSLRYLEAADYIAALTDRTADSSGFIQCPFHKGGQERTPSLLTTGRAWVCYACLAPPGKRAMGGNLYDFVGVLLGYPLPLTREGFEQVREYAKQAFGE